ncbi:hypothetical protein FS842_002199 [Serendipita sp. 407]|nr:hypothetical protein FS842_002199 [Serendipita sp. 407]
MIDQEKPTDEKALPSVSIQAPVDEPPPYSRRQASTSGNRLRSSVQRASTNAGARFIAPESENRNGRPEAPPMPSPRLVVSGADTDYSRQSNGWYDPNMAAASFTDLALEKTNDSKGQYGNHELYGVHSSKLTPVSTGSYASAGPSNSANYQAAEPQNTGAIGIGPHSPTTSSRKNSEAVILMGTGASGMWLNHLVVAQKNEDIKGAYHIDPNLNVPDHATPRRVALLPKKAHARSSSASSGKKKADESWHPTTAPEACNAIFDSKTGAIDILLSIGGMGSSKSTKANIDVRTKNAKAAVKVVEIIEGRRINLDISTVKGDIEVFIPRAFSGPLHVHTDGEITLLPRLAATMEIISAKEDDALVMITSTSKPLPPSPTVSRNNTGTGGTSTPIMSGFGAWLHPQMGSRTQLYEGDFANLTSSSGGDIVVGFLGEDKLKEQSPGLWKKLVKLFQRSNTT